MEVSWGNGWAIMSLEEEGTSRQLQPGEKSNLAGPATQPASPVAGAEDPEVIKNLRKTVDETSVNVRCVYMTVLISLIFIIVLMLVYDSHKLNVAATVIKNVLEKRSWSNKDTDVFNNIGSIVDIDRYFRNVLIPVCTPNTTMLDDNYVIGMRINLKRAEVVNNTIDRYKDDFPKVWANPDLKYDEINPKGETTDRYGIWDYTYDHSFNRAGAYSTAIVVSIYPQEFIQEYGLYRWRTMRMLWLTQQTASIVIEVVIQNSNLKATLYYYQVYEMTSTGEIKTHSHVYGVFAELLGYVNTLSSWIIFLCIVLLLEVLIKIYNAVKLIIRCVIVALKERRNDMEYHESIGILTLVLEITAIILFGTTFIKYSGNLQIPVNIESDLEQIIDQSVAFRAFVQISALCILLIIIRAILILKNEFPSFGILFDTIINARKDIMYFSFIAFTLLLSFAVMSFLLFGMNVSEFSTFGGCLLTLTIMAIGVTNLDSLEMSNSPLAGAFFMVFELLFLFVLVNMFLAIVMSTYTELRRRNQMFIVAKASILTKEAKEMQQRWLNFLLCRRPKGTVIELAKKYAALKKDTKLEPSDREKQMMDLRTTMMQQQTPSLKDTLKYNMSQLDVFQSIMAVQERNLKTREQYIEELIAEISIINAQNKKKREEQAKLESDKVYIYTMIKDMILYTCFIVLFVVMVYFRARIVDKFLMEEKMRTSLSNMKFNSSSVQYQFYDIDDPIKAMDWIEQVYYQVGYDDSWSMHHRVIGTKKIRQTLIRYDPQKNDYSGTAKVFPVVRTPEQFNQEPLTDFTTPSQSLYFIGNVSGYNYTYYSNSNSYRGYGGYVDYWTSNNTQASQALARIRQDNLLGPPCKSFILDFAAYSGDAQLVAIFSVGLMRTEAGGIKPEIRSTSFEMDVYTTDNSFRAVLEVIFILFLIYYCYRVFMDWYVCLKEQRDAWKSFMEEKKLLQSVMDEIQGIENTNRTGSEEFLHFMKRAIDLCIDGTQMFIMASSRFLKKDMFNSLDVVFISLSIGMLVAIGSILLDDFRLNFTLPRDESNENLPEFWHLADLDEQYRSLSSINCLIIFLRMLKNFRFSKRLSVLTEVLDSAALDIVFFGAMFAMIIAAYAVMGYTILGHQMENYSDIEVSFLETYFLLLKDFSVYDILGADKGLGGLFLVSFLVVFNLFLMNMFIAIIVAHFYHVMDDNKNVKHVGLISRLKLTLVEYMKKLGAGRIKKLLERCLGHSQDKKDQDKSEDEEHHSDEIPLEEIPEEEVPLEDVIIPNTSANKWIQMLEDKLWENSLQTLSFVGFKSKMGPEELKNSLLTMKMDVAAIAFMTKDIWMKERSLKKKVYLWRQLSLVHENAQIREQELQIVGRLNFTAQALSPLQASLWSLCPIDLKLKLWTDPSGFNSQERALIWNITQFTPLLLGKKEGEPWDESVQKEAVRNMVAEGEGGEDKSEDDADEEEEEEIRPNLKEELKAFLTALSVSTKKYQKFYEGMNDSVNADLIAYYQEEKDERQILWFALSDLEKCLLFLNNPDDCEAQLLSHMLFEFVNHHIIRLEIMDKTMSDLLDSRIYDKHLRLAEWQAEKTILGQIEDRLEASKADFGSLESYKFFLEKKYQSKLTLLEQKNQLLQEYAGGAQKEGE